MVLNISELPEEEQPDEKIWLDEPALAEHFEARRNNRRLKAGVDDLGTTNKSPRVRAITG